MHKSVYLNADVLFEIAKTAYERTKSEMPDRALTQTDAIVAILFSAATLEALIIELATLAKIQGSPRLNSLATVLESIEKSHGSIRLKFHMAKQVLTCESYVEGHAPFQDFSLLIALRDAIVHLKPQEISDEPHNLMTRLATKELCVPVTLKNPEASSWLFAAATNAAARWACNVVADMVNSIRQALKQCGEQLPEEKTHFTMVEYNFDAFRHVS